MRLTNYSDYALRSLIYLATKPDPYLLANISDIANSYNISKSHLTKIIHQLGQLGYIDSVRGKNGGIRLARAPEDINLGILIKQIEPDFALVECFATSRMTVDATNKSPNKQESTQSVEQSIGKNQPSTIVTDEIILINEHERSNQQALGCVISPVCQLKGVFFEALTAFITVLERYTLADVITNKDELLALLS
ncbi:Rrf2 family transcriptional regulator [Psychrobacter sp. 16-MNA-CIBAN-0192]|uniref:Rrf2 family transcriptional regulator n=1 Tax=Psychrobacter sp. 16-MNA-CIBAN-0192 TaxID=3140448 RepID=UPI00331B77CE